MKHSLKKRDKRNISNCLNSKHLSSSLILSQRLSSSLIVSHRRPSQNLKSKSRKKAFLKKNEKKNVSAISQDNKQRDSHLPFKIQAVQVEIPTISKYKVQEEAVPKE